MIDVLVIGGGNAALCAALMAREAGASVLLLEAAPREWRGGNSQHTRNLRCMHDAPQDVLVEAYTEEEFWADLRKVTGGRTDEALARLVIRASSNCRDWMRRHGVHFQPSLSGTLHVARTNAFFMGGGKALVNAYYRSAERLGVRIRYEAPVDTIELNDGRFVAARVGAERIEARACVLASGGFESNRAWLREAWGQNERGEWPADNFLIRGTRFNTGVLLKFMLDAGADAIGDPSQSHCVAIDARAPLYDGGICTRIDCVSLGIVVNREAQRFYDEGEDFWPKRYAIWGRLVALQPGQIGYSVIDAKAIGRFMPPVFPGTQAQTLPELARALGLDEAAFMRTVTAYNAACRVGRFDHTTLDDCRTEGLAPAKTHWARPLDTPPFYGYALRPGITFTYLGLKMAASVCMDGKILSNYIANQKVHEQYGGVVPELASRAHMQNIVPVVDTALKTAAKNIQSIDAIAFTQSPGLIGSLLVGAQFAKSLSLALNKPLIAVHHMQAHVLANLIADTKPGFPFLCLTVSGGHTQIVLCESPLKMKVIGETIDDAAGEAFDKSAKLLGLPYPGGPLIDQYAKQGDANRFKFPEPQIPGLNFSFSGVKTSILYFLQNAGTSNIYKEEFKATDEEKKQFIANNLADICASIQHRIVTILLNKLKKASTETGIKDICIAGGVSANSGLRKAFEEMGKKNGWNVFIPAFEYCTDNAAMIAIAGYYKYMAGDFADLSVSSSARAEW